MVIHHKVDNMKNFLVLLAVAAVFADPRIDWSSEDDQQEVNKPFEDSQQEMDKLFENNHEVDKPLNDNPQEVGEYSEEVEKLLEDTNDPAVIPTTTHLCSMNVPALINMINRVIDKKFASQPGKSYANM